MGKKTKILAVGDIHGDVRYVKKLAQKAKKENVDLVILAGDLTFIDGPIDNIIGPFAEAGKEVLIMHGNHEPPSTINFLTEMYSNTRSIDGKSFQKNNLGIFGAGGSPNTGPFLTEESEIAKMLQESYKEISKNKNLTKKIMVTHMHPFGSKSEFSGFKGSKSVTEAIKKFNPDILINGHIHEAGGIEEKIGNTKVINVARKEKIFEI